MKHPEHEPINRFYLYVISSLKSSAVINGAKRYASSQRDYLPNLICGIRTINRYVEGRGAALFAALDYKLEILTAGGDEPWQARLAIRCPSGWSPSHFKDKALDRWNRSPWIAHTDIAMVVRGSAIHQPFYERDWDGRFRAHLPLSSSIAA